MSSHRAQHNFESIKREIIAILRELKDPRLKSELLSVAKTVVTHDGSACRIFISSLGGLEDCEKSVKILESASGHIRKELGERLRLRYIPSLKFIATDAAEYAVNMSKKIDQIISK